MNLPTYIFLMISAIIYGLYNSAILWQINLFLFWASIFITIITAVGGILQSINADNLEFKWMLWYTIPLAFLAISSLMSNTETIDSSMIMIGLKPLEHFIPGRSQDYRNAAVDHFLSMIFPLVALLVAKIVQFFRKAPSS